MELIIIELIHKTIIEKWIPIYEGEKTREPDCALCKNLNCLDCPIFGRYDFTTCSCAKGFGYNEWVQQAIRTKFKKHDPKALKVLQNVIRLLPVGEITVQEKKYLEIK